MKEKFINLAKKELSPRNFELFLVYLSNNINVNQLRILIDDHGTNKLYTQFMLLYENKFGPE